jgi:hypothetical protein
MNDGITTFAGLIIPSSDPIFLSVIALHIPLGVTAAVSGVLAMLSRKAHGRHPRFGTLYFWSTAAIFVSAGALSIMRWREDYHLFVLGALCFIAALVGRSARRRRFPGWARVHITAMGSSYVLLLTAFYVDNGKQLPLWRDLPVWSYWLLPAVIGVPLILRALVSHPIARGPPDAGSR